MGSALSLGMEKQNIYVIFIWKNGRDSIQDGSGPRWVVTHVHSICIFFMCCCKHDGFIQSLEKHTVSTYYVPGAVLGDTVLGLNDGPILV